VLRSTGSGTLCPSPLKPFAAHHAVLDREKAQKTASITKPAQAALRTKSILWGRQIPDETIAYKRDEKVR